METFPGRRPQFKKNIDKTEWFQRTIKILRRLAKDPWAKVKTAG